MEGLPAWTAIARDFSHFLQTRAGASDKPRSEGTANTYVYKVKLFWQWCLEHETDPRSADRALIRHWCFERQEQVSKATAHNELAAVRAFYEFCNDEGWRADNPTEAVKVKRAKNLPTKPITQAEFDACLAVCDERDALILLVFGYTSMRVSEVAELRVEDIDWQRGTITIFGKGEKQRLAMPNPEVLQRLHAYVGMFPTSGPVFRSRDQHRALASHQLRKIIYDIGARAGVPDLAPHRIRAFFAVKHIRQFGDLDALAYIMGHASTETTQRYVQWTQEERGLEQMRRMA